MFKVIGLVGTLAPVVVLVFLFVHRRRAPLPAGLGMIGAALAGVGSLAEFVSSRTVWFGDDGAEDMVQRIEAWDLLRFGVVVGGLVLLVVAALIGPGRTVPRIPLAVGGMIVAALGCAMRFVHPDLADADGTVRVLATMAIGTVQYGLLGLGILLVGIAVVSGRDAGPEPLGQAATIARRVARTVQDNRDQGARPGSGSRSATTTSAVWNAIWDSVADKDSGTGPGSGTRGGGDADRR